MLMCNFTLTITDEMLYGGTKMQNQSFSKDEVEKWVATSTYKSIAWDDTEGRWLLVAIRMIQNQNGADYNWQLAFLVQS